MFPLGELSSFRGEIQHCRLIKPWWDILTDYLGLSLLLLAFLTGTMQLGLDRTVCMPAIDCLKNQSNISNSSTDQECHSVLSKTNATQKTMITSLNHKQHYDFVDNVCGLEAFHWFASYLPFIIFLQSVFLLVMDNFWLKFPKTASRVESFLSLVMDCYNSPGTVTALTHSLIDDGDTEKSSPGHSSLTSPEAVQHQNSQYTLVDVSPEEGTDSPAAVAEGESFNESFGFMSSTSFGRQLEAAEMMKAKTLAEKVMMFREKAEQPLRVGFGLTLNFGYVQLSYIGQWFLQVISSLLFLVVNFMYSDTLTSSVRCSLDVSFQAEYQYFVCSNSLAPLLDSTLIIYEVCLGCYCYCCLVALIWTSLKLFRTKIFSWNTRSERSLRVCDIPDSDKDMSILLHLLDRYSPLHVLRFGPFLSKVNLKLLNEFTQERQWPLSKLRRMLGDGRTSLTMTDLSGVPGTVFDLEDLDTLKFQNCHLSPDCFEFVKDTVIGERFCKLNLKRLIMKNCMLTEIPIEIFEMVTLSELDLSENMIKEIPGQIERLSHLETLNVSSNNLITLSPNIGNLSELIYLNLENNPSLLTDETKTIVSTMTNLKFLYVDTTLAEVMGPELQQRVVESSSTIPGGDVVPYDPEKAPQIASLIESGRIPVYRMLSRPKGILLVINNVEYMSDSQLPPRIGADIDEKRIQLVFQRIGYEVRIFNDVTAQGFLTVIDDTLSDNEYHRCDSFAMFVLSHGENDSLRCVDGKEITIQTMVDRVTAFPHLSGKPKLFFVQACRGTEFVRNSERDATEVNMPPESPTPKNLSPRIFAVAEPAFPHNTTQENTELKTIETNPAALNSSPEESKATPGGSTQYATSAVSAVGGPITPLTEASVSTEPSKTTAAGDDATSVEKTGHPTELPPDPKETEDEIAPTEGTHILGQKGDRGESAADLQSPVRKDETDAAAASRSNSSREDRNVRQQPLMETLPGNDMLIAYSTMPGHVSWRNTERGSWFVSALAEVFAKYAWEEDVLNLLTLVNYEVSRKYKTRQEYRQIPAPVHMLSKKLYFLPNYFEDSDNV